MDRICMKTDSDISDICFPVSFQFPPPRMETDRIRIEMDSDILDIHFSISLPFPSLVAVLPRAYASVHSRTTANLWPGTVL